MEQIRIWCSSDGLALREKVKRHDHFDVQKNAGQTMPTEGLKGNLIGVGSAAVLHWAIIELADVFYSEIFRRDDYLEIFWIVVSDQ